MQSEKKITVCQLFTCLGKAAISTVVVVFASFKSEVPEVVLTYEKNNSMTFHITHNVPAVL